jgi:hypothetical protein
MVTKLSRSNVFKDRTYPVSALQLLADAVLEVSFLVVVVLVVSVVHLLEARSPMQRRRIAQRRYTTQTDTSRKRASEHTRQEFRVQRPVLKRARH